jgi:hypothetical protein
VASTAGPCFEGCPVQRLVDTETTIILPALAVSYPGYLCMIDWIPELGLIGNLAR